MNRHAVSTYHAPASLGPYSQAIVAGGFVFCSGTAGIDPESGPSRRGSRPKPSKPSETWPPFSTRRGLQ